jgi:hypothetical protein
MSPGPVVCDPVNPEPEAALQSAEAARATESAKQKHGRKQKQKHHRRPAQQKKRAPVTKEESRPIKRKSPPASKVAAFARK